MKKNGKIENSTAQSEFFGEGGAVETVDYAFAGAFSQSEQKRAESGISDDEIEELLFSDEPIPEPIAKKISPSRRAFLLTVWGLALCALQLPNFESGGQFLFNRYSEIVPVFPYLGILLPAAGLILCFLGLRVLKKVNRAFGFSFALCFVRAALFLCGIVFTFSVLHEGEAGRTRAIILGALTSFSMLAQIFGVFAGFRGVRAEIGFEAKSGEFLVLAVWYALRAALPAYDGAPIFLMIGMQAAFLLILLALHLLTQSFDEAGYAVRAERTRFSTLSLTSAGALVLACTLFFSFSCLGKYRMSEARREAGADEAQSPEQQLKAQEMEQIRDRLVELGVPEHIVNDISDGELELFKGAERAALSSPLYQMSGRLIGTVGEGETVEGITGFTSDIPLNASLEFVLVAPENGGSGARIVLDEEGDPVVVTIRDALPDGFWSARSKVRITTVAVETESSKLGAPFTRYCFIHYFEYDPELTFPGTEALRVNPPSKSDYAFEAPSSGRLLFERGGESFGAAFNSLESPGFEYSNASSSSSKDGETEMVSYTVTDVGNSPDGNIYASFSVPDGAEKVRGYVVYSVMKKNSLSVSSSMHMTLVHQRRAGNISGKTAYELIKFNSRMSDVFYWADQTLLFDPERMAIY